MWTSQRYLIHMRRAYLELNNAEQYKKLVRQTVVTQEQIDEVISSYVLGEIGLNQQQFKMSFQHSMSDGVEGDANREAFTLLQDQITQMKFKLRKKMLNNRQALYKIVPRVLSRDETLEIF